MRLISMKQAANLGVERLRKPVWADPLDQFKIDIIDGQLGPWVHLFAPFNKECNGRDPVDILWALNGNPDEAAYEIYDGPLPDSEEYRTAQAQFDGVLGEVKP